MEFTEAFRCFHFTMLQLVSVISGSESWAAEVMVWVLQGCLILS